MSARRPVSYRGDWERRPRNTIGNLISVTKPMGSGNAATPTVYIYDADRRKTGEIGPAPTGNGHYRATRTTYDGDARVLLEETGYTTSQSDLTLSTFVSLKQVASVYDASGRKIQDAHSGGGATLTLTQYSYDALDRLVCTAVRMNLGGFAGLMATHSSSSTASGVLPTAACSLGPQADVYARFGAPVDQAREVIERVRAPANGRQVEFSVPPRPILDRSEARGAQQPA